ncbi:MAG: nitrate reductase cytochrome c-type subunit [Flavobacteriaceae bacterium]|nr:nitrate reductase cytochrome c-type subunit [Flavobacteriaceae bacterium]
MKRLFIIFLLVILMIAGISIWNYSYQTSKTEAYVPVSSLNEKFIIPSEEGVFERSKFALEYADMPIDKNHERSLDTYYKNRAFYGAPPSIPHPVEERNMGANSCLKCHDNGGFVSKFNAYTPVTPHPEKVNCRQCHVPIKSESLFVATNWSRTKGASIGNKALISSPPVIPHQIQLRENCLSCHAGPSAPKEIRTTHPDRVNCRQCHVINDKKIQDIGTFKRAIK